MIGNSRVKIVDRAAEAMLGFLGKAILVFWIEGKRTSVNRVGGEINAREVKIDVIGKQQDRLIAPSSSKQLKPLLQFTMYQVLS